MEKIAFLTENRENNRAASQGWETWGHGSNHINIAQLLKINETNRKGQWIVT